MIKKILHILLSLLIVTNLTAQTVSTFENLPVPAIGYWNGLNPYTLVSGFQDGNAYFVNSYDTSFSGYWAGWGYSNVKDTVTATYANQFGCIAGMGYDSSSNYAVAYIDYVTQNNKIRIMGNGSGKIVKGFYITNTTLTYKSLLNGDGFAKKFGGTTGNDPDYFRLKIKAYNGATLLSDSVVFYLADYRSSNNSADYIIKDWTWVDLQQFGNIDSLTYTLESSDTTTTGYLNTPTYFAIDNFTTLNTAVGMHEELLTSVVNVYPNPCVDFLNIKVLNDKNTIINIYTIDGKRVYYNSVYKTVVCNTSQWPLGVYLLEVIQENKKVVYKIQK